MRIEDQPTESNMRTLTRAHWRRAVHSIVGGGALADLHPRSSHAGMAELYAQHGPWFRQPNVVGLGVGAKITKGARGERALQVFVRRKRLDSAVNTLVPIPDHVDGRPLGFKGSLPTDVCGVGDPRSQSLVVVARPALPGYDIGDQSGVSGTIGCAVRDRTTNAVLGLSCAHVLATGGPAPGGLIYVPSFDEAQDMGVVGEAEIGTVTAVANIGFATEDAARNVDAATFAPTEPNSFAASIATLGKKPSGVRTVVTLGLNVRKVGAASGDTHGVVQTIDASVKMMVPDATGSTNEALFIDQIGITSFTQDGDSGALVLDHLFRAVGLHFWAADGISVCQPIQRVLDALGCDLA
jgi:hypothetical protein